MEGSPVIFEVAHQIGLVPIVAMLLLGRGLPRAYWLVAAAFATSWVGDSMAQYGGGSWAGTYVWLPMQFALVLAAVALDRAPLWFPVLIVAGVVSAIVSAPGPEWVVTLWGSATVLAWARRELTPFLGVNYSQNIPELIFVPLWIYFGAGSLAYFWMLATMSDTMPAWYAYQGCRALAFVVFVWLTIGGRSWDTSQRKSYPGSPSSSSR